MERVAAVIPAYNEAERIGDVLSAVCAVDEIAEVIVVSDGSTDDTADVARKVGPKVKVLEFASNQGKERHCWLEFRPLQRGIGAAGC